MAPPRARRRAPLRSLAAALALPLALAVSLAPAGAPGATRVVRVLSKATGTSLVRDTPPLGTPSAGDVLGGTSLLRNAAPQFGRAKGAVVGRDRWRLALETSHGGTYTVTVTLPGGTISCRGVGDDRRTKTVLRVVGGTGAFARARGTCEASAAPANAYGADSLNVYRLAA